MPKRVHRYSPPPPPPTREELRRIFDHASGAKARTAVALKAFAGLRTQYIQTLTLKDVPDLIVQLNTVQFTRTPAKLVPQSMLRNPPIRTFTFLCEPGCSYLLDSLKERLGKGEQLNPQTQVIPSPSSSIIALAVKQAVRAAGFDFKPYDLRRYFLTRLMVANTP
jgi:integrase